MTKKNYSKYEAKEELVTLSFNHVLLHKKDTKIYQVIFLSLLKNYKFVNVVAASTFGVLLIHDNCAIMRQWLWQELVNVKAIYSLTISSAMLQMVSVVLAVFIICILLDMLRKRTFERWILNQINKKL